MKVAQKFSALVVGLFALLTLLGIGAASAVETGYSDGSTFSGQVNYGKPPTDPAWAKGQECQVDVIDPPSFVYVTEHVVYGSTPPPAGVVPVSDDAHLVFPYHGVAPGLFTVDVSSIVQGKQGFRSNTWNIGTGVTTWVPFDCRVPETTTTSTVAPTTTTSGPTTSSVPSASTVVTVAPTPHHQTAQPAALPRTGAATDVAAVTGLVMVAAGAALATKCGRKMR